MEFEWIQVWKMDTENESNAEPYINPEHKDSKTSKITEREPLNKTGQNSIKLDQTGC
jgi:hypothetical protein